MNAVEMRAVDGGFIPLLLAAYIISDIACVAIAVGAYNGFKNAEQASKK